MSSLIIKQMSNGEIDFENKVPLLEKQYDPVYAFVSTPVTTASLYNQPHHVINKFMHSETVENTADFDVVLLTEPTSPASSERPLSSLSTLCSTVVMDDDRDDDDSDIAWKKKFQSLLSNLVTQSGELETMSVELLKMEVKVRELILLEKMLTEQYEEQEQLYLDKLWECQGVYYQQEKMIQQLSNLELDLQQSTSPTETIRDKVDLIRLKVGLFMGGSVGTGHVVHSFESPTHELEYIIAGSGTTSSYSYNNLQHLQFNKHQYMLHIDHQDRKTKFTLLPKHLWTPDSQSDICQFKSCPMQFSFFNRKHHCRRCGILVCQKHSLNRLPLFSSSTMKAWYRICDQCFYDLIIVKKRTDSATHLPTLC